MKYLLGVGIIYKPYRKKCRIIISTDDMMIDDYFLEQSIDSVNFYTGKPKNKKNHRGEDMAVWKEGISPKSFPLDEIPGGGPRRNIPSNFKLYEIDDSHLSGNIFIKVENNDTNYTNGFMTNSSLIQPRMLFLLPSHLYDFKKIDELYNISRGFTNDLYTLEKNGMKFPCAERYYLTDMSGVEKEADSLDWLGGSFTLRIPITTYEGSVHSDYSEQTKNILMLNFPHSEKNPGILPISNAFRLYMHRIHHNKYKQL